jgi:hypothetical protein
VTLGNSASDITTNVGRFVVRSVANAVATSPIGNTGEIAFDTTTTKFVGCTVGGASGTWVALH